MYQENIYRHPFQPEDISGKKRITDILKKCKCGNPTYLDSPCPVCGSKERKEFFTLPDKYKFWGYGIATITVPLLLASVVSWFFLSSILSILMIVCWIFMLATSIKKILALDSEQTDLYWMFHSFNMKKYLGFDSWKNIRAIDSDIQEQILDAYYQDLGYLEQLVYDMGLNNISDEQAWMKVWNDANRLFFIYSNTRLAKLQFEILHHLPVKSFAFCRLNEVCRFLNAVDLSGYNLWELQHFLGDYLLLADYTECNEVKRLFDVVTINLLVERQNLGSRPNLPVGDEETLRGLLDICGASLFEKAWPEQEQVVANHTVIVPNDADSMLRLTEQMIEYCRVNRSALIAKNKWFELIFYTSQFKHPAMKRLTFSLLESFTQGKGEGFECVATCIAQITKSQGQKNLYQFWINERLSAMPCSVLTLLIPEEMLYVCRIWNRCLTNADGILYSEISDFDIGTLLKCFNGEDEYIRTLEEYSHGDETEPESNEPSTVGDSLEDLFSSFSILED